MSVQLKNFVQLISANKQQSHLKLSNSFETQAFLLLKIEIM